MKYFKYNYKKLIMPTIFITLIGLVFYTTPIMLARVRVNLNNPGLSGLNTFLIIIAYFMPVYEFRVLKQKRGSDMLYGLPISKRELKFTIYLKGLIEIVISYTLIYVLTFIVVLMKGFNFYFIYYIPLYFLLLVGLISLYSFNTYIFNKANNTLDGIIFLIAFAIIPAFVYATIDRLFNINYFIDPLIFSPTSLINMYMKHYSYLIKNNTLYKIKDTFELAVFIIYIIISFSLLLVNLLYSKNSKVEDVEKTSNTYIGYKVLIPLTIITYLLIINARFDYFSILSVVLTSLVGYSFYVLYERSFKIKSYNYLVLILSIIIPIIINILTSI